MRGYLHISVDDVPDDRARRLTPPPARRAPRGGLCALALLMALVGAPGAQRAQASPLRVRAHSTLSLRVERAAEGLYLRARLASDDGEGLGDQAVHAAVEGLAGRTYVTDAEGRFELFVTASDARQLANTLGEQVSVAVTYEGDATWGPASERSALDLRREPTWVELSVEPARVGLDDAQVTIRGAVASAAGAVGEAPLKLRVGDGPELVGDSDADGRVTFLVRPDGIDRAGDFEVRAAYSGDHRFAPSEARAMLRVLRPTRLTLRVGREGDDRSGRFRFSGRLSDDRGGVAGATIAIVIGADGEAASSETLAVTDEDGVYLVALDVRELSARMAGVVEVTARYVPTDGANSGAQSRPARVPVPSPPGVPLRWYGVAMVVAGLNLLLVGAVRQRIRRWFEAMASRFRAPPPQESPVVVDPALVLVPARGAGRRLDWVAGAVVDAHHGRRVVGATARAEAVAGAEALRGVPTAGGFALGPLTPGTWRLVLTAPGYLSRETELRVPHDGSFDGATLAMVSIRGRVRDLFVSAMAGLGRGVRWGRDTPTEVVRSMPAEPGAEALRVLVEEVWFGAEAPDAEAARRAEAVAESLRGAR